MNIKRLILAIVVAFIVLWVTDFLIHGVWMTPDYRATQQLWRTDAEMTSRMGWMLCGQLLFVITFVIVWAKRVRQLHSQNQLRGGLWSADGIILGSLGADRICYRADAGLNCC